MSCFPFCLSMQRLAVFAKHNIARGLPRGAHLTLFGQSSKCERVTHRAVLLSCAGPENHGGIYKNNITLLQPASRRACPGGCLLPMKIPRVLGALHSANSFPSPHDDEFPRPNISLLACPELPPAKLAAAIFIFSKCDHPSASKLQSIIRNITRGLRGARNYGGWRIIFGLMPLAGRNDANVSRTEIMARLCG